MTPRAAQQASTTVTASGGDTFLFKAKLFMMVFLMVFDIGLNSSVEHDDLGVGTKESRDGTILALILGLQLVVQAGIFASLFIMMFETYPFRVGLMGMLTSQYLKVYLINVVYFLMTAFIYGYRVGFDKLIGLCSFSVPYHFYQCAGSHKQGLAPQIIARVYAYYGVVFVLDDASMVRDTRMGIWQIWDLSGYLPLSVLHKIAATMYYVVNIQAALTLGDPMFYNKHAWVGLYFDRGTLGGGRHRTYNNDHHGGGGYLYRMDGARNYGGSEVTEQQNVASPA